MAELVAEAEGRDGVIRLYGDRVEIAREGLLARGVHFGQGDRSLPLELVGEIRYESPSGFSAGALEILPLGCEPADGRLNDGAYAVTFVGDETPFEDLHATFYRLRPSGPAALSPASGVDATLGELVQRLARGDLSRTQFDEAVHPRE